MEKTMKTSSLIVLLAAGAALLAGPAFAKTSITKGQQVCEAAAQAQTPAPKSVQTDRDETRVHDDVLTFVLKVRKADDTSVVLACSIDRATGTPTLKPAS
jgi:hypothetical protein